MECGKIYRPVSGKIKLDRCAAEKSEKHGEVYRMKKFSQISDDEKWQYSFPDRVIGASGSLVGYRGGLDLKSRLLKLEKERTYAIL